MSKIKSELAEPRSRTATVRSYAWMLAVSAAATIALTALAFGERGGAWLSWAAQVSWRPHAPNLDLLAAASPAIQVHLAGVLTAFVIGSVLMLGTKGTRLHKTLGWVWVAAMLAGAVSSLFIRELNGGSLSFLHAFSGWTLVAAPMGVAAVRRGKVRLHARTMTGLFLGGLVIAGIFAFLPGRLMWSIFLG
jgi:uncharacterized membrane protein